MTTTYRANQNSSSPVGRVRNLSLVVEGQTLGDGIIGGQARVAVAGSLALGGSTLSMTLATSLSEAGTERSLGAGKGSDDSGELHDDSGKTVL